MPLTNDQKARLRTFTGADESAIDAAFHAVAVSEGADFPTRIQRKAGGRAMLDHAKEHVQAIQELKRKRRPKKEKTP